MYGSDDKLWLQYWFFFTSIPTRSAAATGMRGDWEMVQVGLAGDLTPRDAVYAQHDSGQRCGWPAVERAGEQPVVYVAEHSHASYFGPDRIPFPYNSYDDADGLGGGLFLGELEQIGDGSPAWVGWNGSWGDSGHSPRGPRFQPDGKWSDPKGWADRAVGC